MSVPYSTFTIYQFGSSAQFNRLTESNYQEWFGSKVQFTQDAVKGSTRDYVDIGATGFEPLAFVAVFGSVSERDDMASRIGSEATLSNSKGFSDTAILISAQRIDVNGPSLYGLQVSFVKRPV